jgi:hypothetical protein
MKPVELSEVTVTTVVLVTVEDNEEPVPEAEVELDVLMGDTSFEDEELSADEVVVPKLSNFRSAIVE